MDDERAELTQPFEENRSHLRAVAYRMLGSLSEADDAVQEAWLRLSHADTRDVSNLGGYLTRVVARVCLDFLRSRKARGEQELAPTSQMPAAPDGGTAARDPEHEAMMADSVGLALLVVLETLTPAERVAFVLHEMFTLPFEEIAQIAGRSPAAVRQLASRARRRIQGQPRAVASELGRQRSVVEAYLGAVRKGDVEALVAMLDPDVVLRTDAAVTAAGGAGELRGARAAATEAITAARGARFARVALVDGTVGLIVAPRGQLTHALRFTFAGDTIREIEVLAGPSRLAQLTVGLL